MNYVKNDPDVIRWRKLIDQPDWLPEIPTTVIPLKPIQSKPPSSFRRNARKSPYSQHAQQGSAQKYDIISFNYIPETLLEGQKISIRSNQRKINQVRNQYNSYTQARVNIRVQSQTQIIMAKEIGVYTREVKVQNKIKKIYDEVEELMGYN
ncbi:hypothetical protein SS50377_23724 [Spironucleus salmonicida]|uniref:Uncharacterized protein n=1 Tax=Spironucleus salmonicida TaxID=348837 RepID=V6LQ78_9EUKA|nr:hypothetical protein SS50377_23724 [Spironucleus salmonicida]|eukprot:EST46403.1 Hypothetical protein SS50377_13487 [Spironucleus salmonicida]